MLKARSTLHKVNQDAYATLMASLIAWPADCYKLAEVSGLHIKTTQDLMRAFHRKGCVFICGWIKDPKGRDTTPIFALKLKPTDRDVPRARKSRAEIAKAYRERKGIAPTYPNHHRRSTDANQ